MKDYHRVGSDRIVIKISETELLYGTPTELQIDRITSDGGGNVLILLGIKKEEK